MKQLIMILLLTSAIFSQDNTTIMCESIDDFDDSRTLTSGGEILFEDGGDLKMCPKCDNNSNEFALYLTALFPDGLSII